MAPIVPYRHHALMFRTEVMMDPGKAADNSGGVSARRRSVLVDQAAELLGVSRRTVYNRIREGRLLTIRTRCGSQRVLLDSIEALLRSMRGIGGDPTVGGRSEATKLETQSLAL